MITTLRAWLKGKGAQYFMLFMVLLIAVVWMLPPSFRSSRAGAEHIATVNGEKIAANDYYRHVRAQEEFLDNFRRRYGPYADALLKMYGQSDPATSALEIVIRNALLNQAARGVGLVVHPDLMNFQGQDIRAIQPTVADLIPSYVVTQEGLINAQQLSSYLQRVGLTPSQFYEKLEDAIRRDELIRVVGAAAYVPAFAVREQFITDYVGKKFSVVKLEYDTFLHAEEKRGCTEDDARAFYEQNKQRYRVAEKRGGVQWKVDPAHYDIVVDEEDINDYYRDKKDRFVDQPTRLQVSHILVTDQAKAQELYTKVSQAPDTFASVAREMSEDKESAARGGQLPAFSKGTHEEGFERAAFALKNDRDISHVIQTSKGFEIIQRNARTDKTYKPLSAVKKQIHDVLAGEKFSRRFTQDMKEFTGSGEVDEAAFEKLIANLKAKREEIAPKEKGQNKLVQELFKMKKGEYETAIEDGMGIVIHLTTIQESYIPEFAAVKKAVEHDVFEMRAAKAVEHALEQAREELKTESIDAVAKKVGSRVETTGFLKYDEHAQELAKKNHWPLEKMLQLEKAGLVGTAIANHDGYIFRLDSLEQWTDKDLEAKRAEIYASLSREYGRATIGGFVASLQRNGTIVQETISKTYTENDSEEEDNTI